MGNIGNMYKRDTLKFDISNVQDYVSTIIDTFSPDIFLPKEFEDSKQVPIFIVGMPRSGTTLVEQIIASHSSVIGGGELPILRDVINGQGASKISIAALNKSNIGYPSGVLSLLVDDLFKIGNAYLDLVNDRLNTKKSFTDRSNSFFLTSIESMKYFV